MAGEDRQLAAAAGAIGGRALAAAFRLLCGLAGQLAFDIKNDHPFFGWYFELFGGVLL